MPSLLDHHAATTLKILYLGDSGAGKTGSLATLINTGKYDFKILDYDNGLDILLEYTKPEYLSKVSYVTCTDAFSPKTKGPAAKGIPKAFSTGMQSLSKWPDDGSSIVDWGPSTVFVLDSLTTFGDAALQYTLALNGRAGEHPWQSDWGEAMERQQKTLEMLYSEDVKCHVIVTAHIYKGTKMETTTKADGSVQKIEVETDKGLPSALGRKLPPKVGRYFNNTLRCSVKGTRRFLRTVTDLDVDLKNAFPDTIPPDLEIKGGDPNTGLGKFFDLAQARVEEQKKKAVASK